MQQISNQNTLTKAHSLFSAMHEGAMVVTPNNRLSHQLLSDYALSQQGKRTTIEKPLCLPYQGFLHYLFNQLRQTKPHIKHPILLSDIQQRYLWQRILRRETTKTSNDGLLNEIREAWKRCQQWQIKADNASFSSTPETRQYQLWQKSFQTELDLLSAITTEQLVDYLSQFSIQLKAIKKIIWVSFDDYSPTQQTLQQHLITHGYEQYHHDLTTRSGTVYQYPAKDQQDEYQQLMTWIDSRVALGDKRIGIIIPDLQTQGTVLKRLLHRRLSTVQFNISLGQPFSDFQLVAHALHWLSLSQAPISRHQAHLLLQSPYLAGSKTEFVARANFMQHSPVLKEAYIPRTAFQQKLPILDATLAGLTDYPIATSVIHWIEHFKQRLNQIGFPGEYSLNSANYQCFQRLLSLFDDFLQCATITPTMTVQEALNTIHMLAKTTIFQLKQPTTSVMVLGLLEASGCTFDSIWCTGLTNQRLPQKINLSAFIPLDIQRKHQMPHASIEREIKLAEQLIHRFQNAGEQVVFSYPTLSGDLPHLPSHLIAHLPYFTPMIMAHKNQSALIAYDETYLIPLASSETVSGGATLLSNQAKCPFRAFAAHRLRAIPLEQHPSEGLDASERGQVLHKVMELFWQQVSRQSQLRSLNDTALTTLIEDSITSALAPLLSLKYASFPKVAQEVEFNRLKQLMLTVLDWEKQRPDFIIDAVEQNFSINLAGLDFKIRVDRLDRLVADESKKILIDYKSTLPSQKPWLEDRPQTPQLLLYALLDAQIKAILFMELKSNRITISGLSEQQTDISGVQVIKKEEAWLAHLQTWLQKLTELADEFKTGLCYPKPNQASTCRDCSFSSLCRIAMR